MFKPVTFVSLALLASTTAFAADKCQAGPASDRQPKETLEKALVAEGWKIQKIKVDDGCYEVYGTDAKGNKVETWFHPKTLAPAPR